MYRILRYLNELESLICLSDVVIRWELIERRVTLLTGYLNAKLFLRDGTELFVIEYIVLDKEVKRLKYKYHWQDNRGDMIARWDNVPHHPELDTFPNHKHTPDSIERSEELTLEKVLGLIGKELKRT